MKVVVMMKKKVEMWILVVKLREKEESWGCCRRWGAAASLGRHRSSYRQCGLVIEAAGPLEEREGERVIEWEIKEKYS